MKSEADVGDEEAEFAIEIEEASVVADCENGLPFQEDSPEDVPARVTYIDYLKSPVIGLLVGQGDERTLLTAHQALLVTSPWFADACSKFSDEVSVRRFFTLMDGRGI